MHALIRVALGAMPNADLVLEGGGVKGLGLIGAVERLMVFPRFGGQLTAWVEGDPNAKDKATISC